MKQCWICQAAFLILAGCLIGFWHSNYHPQRKMIIDLANKDTSETANDNVAVINENGGDDKGNSEQIDRSRDGDDDMIIKYDSWPEMITVEQAFQAFTDKTYTDEYETIMDIIFIDARSPDDYAQGHITGAYNITDTMFMRGDLPEDMEWWTDNQIIIVYCTGGGCDVSHQLKIRLENYRFTNLHIIDQGINGWENAEYPLTKGSNRQ